MEGKKTINIDQNLLKVTPSKKKEKRVKSEKMAKVKPQSVKELLLQKLKEYKKQKKRETQKQNSLVPSNSIISNSFMDTIQKRRNKTVKSEPFLVIENQQRQFLDVRCFMKQS